MAIEGAGSGSVPEPGPKRYSPRPGNGTEIDELISRGWIPAEDMVDPTAGDTSRDYRQTRSPARPEELARLFEQPRTPERAEALAGLGEDGVYVEGVGVVFDADKDPETGKWYFLTSLKDVEDNRKPPGQKPYI